MLSLARLRQDYLARIENEFHEGMERSPLARNSVLRPMIDYHYSSGGKRLRALSVLWARAGVAPGVEDAIPFAVAVEMIHNATLIHDDLQDGDELRRGNPTLWKKYSAAQAINCGDVLFFEAFRTILGSQLSSELKLQLQELVVHKTSLVIEGQAQEFALKASLAGVGSIPSLHSYETMVMGKTAALFAMPLVGGALIGGAPKASLAELEAGSMLLGLAFQIQDDFIDLWGSKGRASRGSDIAEGKLSFPAFMGMELLPLGDDASRFRKILASPREETAGEDVEWAIHLLESLGIKEKCRIRLDEVHSELGKLPLWGARLSTLFAEFT